LIGHTLSAYVWSLRCALHVQEDVVLGDVLHGTALFSGVPHDQRHDTDPYLLNCLAGPVGVARHWRLPLLRLEIVV